MNSELRLSLHSPTARALLVLIAVPLVLLALAIHNSPAPRIESEFGGATVDIRADRAWTLLPGDCVTIAWDLPGSEAIRVDGRRIVGPGAMEYCPSLRSARPDFDIFAASGGQETVVLDIRYLPSEIIRCLAFLAIVSFLILALYYLWTERICEPIPFSRLQFLSLIAFLILCLLFQTGGLLRIDYLLNTLSRIFSSRAWQAVGLLLSGLVFIPLAARSLKSGLKNDSREDFIAIGTFLLFMLLLYLPFGFDSVGHWERWGWKAFLESDQPIISSELVSRSWSIIPEFLATLIDPESFAGYHLVNFFLHWGKLALLYGILRKLNMIPLFAFLTALLFMVFPVNPNLMSIRNIHFNANQLSLLAAVFFCLDFINYSGRLRLAAVWLSTLLCIWSYEAGYAIIIVVPLLWWRRSSRWTWRNVNLTVIWYLFPVVKIAFILLLDLDSRQFYGSTLVSNSLDSWRFALDSITYYAGTIEGVYRQTFWYGWREALSALSQSAWIAPSIAALTLTGGIAAYLAHNVNENMFPSRRQISIGLLSGCLFVLPSIGVLMWFEKYNFDLWRVYIFVPAGAAIALFCLILLISSLIKHAQLRIIFIIAVCLIAIFPGLARLFAQHAFHVNNANNKAKILLQIVEQAPVIDPGAYVILATEMLGTELRAKGVSEFRTGAFRSALRVVYQDPDLKYAFICIIDKRCFLDEYTTQAFHLKQITDYSNVVLFRLHDNLSVELLRDLPPELRDYARDSYNPDRLIDTSAPIPPRALTMLASAKRD